MKKIISILVLIVCMGCVLCSCSIQHGNQSAESKPHIVQIYNDDIYEFIDSETGVHYWIYSHGQGNGGMGGMTPRLNADGSIMVD